MLFGATVHEDVVSTSSPGRGAHRGHGQDVALPLADSRPAPDPYLRFRVLRSAAIRDTREGTDEGFEVAYFDRISRFKGREHCAIVDLPEDGPTLDPRTPASERRAIGPQTSDVLASMAGMEVDSAPFTILVCSSHPADAVQRAALRLAHAIVADAKATGRQHRFL
jgi:hypothetical protein